MDTRELSSAPEVPRWLSHFSRVTTGRPLLPEVDGLRCLAIVAVVLFHIDAALVEAHPVRMTGDTISVWIHQVCRRGTIGVPLFFAISGFILMLPFARHHAGIGEPVSLKAYFLRRLTRLEPPYVICMVVLFAMRAWHFKQPFSESAPHLAASLAYLHNVIYGRPSVINEVAWSLEVEVQFYCIAPLLALAFRWPAPVRRLALIAVAVAGCAMTRTDLDRYRSLLTSIQFFTVGALCADVYTNGGSARRPSPAFDLLFAIGLAIPLVFAPPAQWSLWPFIAPLAVAAMLVGTLWSVGARRFFQIPLVFVTGGMCYTIYLWHSILWSFLWHRTQSIGRGFAYGPYLALQAALILPCLLVACGLLFRCLERPFMRRDWPAHWMAALGFRRAVT